jgi:hypothetical protein
MALLAIILLLLIFTAWRSGHPLKLVLNAEESKAVKARWWAAARGELRAWMICFVVGFAVLWEPLSAMHWSVVVYAAIAWASLLLFSRLAIWGTLILGVPAWCIGAAAEKLGHSICPPFYVIGPIIAAVGAMLIRCMITLCFASSQPASAKAIPARNE